MALDTFEAKKFEIEVALGNIPKHTRVNKFGRNSVVGTTQLTVWDGGAATFPFPLTASTVSIVSSSAQDAIAGTGVYQIIVRGLDANYDKLSETVSLTGTTPVITTGSFLRVFRMLALTPGSGASWHNSNAGTITATLGGSTIAIMGIGNGQTQMAVYTVPRATTVCISHLWSSILKATGTTARAVDIELHIISALGISRVLFTYGLQNTGAGILDHTFTYPLIVAEKNDIIVMATASGLNTDVSTRFTMIEIM